MTNESVECPLCMEPMDFDDVDFYPCPCRYQICRFCWDKIINEENGLCPACRKPYNSEHPASYKPRTEEEIKNKIKHSKKVCVKKVKTVPEGKEYLSEYRVLQKNLIFVVGLPMRMAEEVELLKGMEYFGRCGKVYKIVINQNQTFPGPQIIHIKGTPCLSAYVTYHRNEDALKTLVDLKKLEIDGRAVKLSLGTTKYCSQFLRNRRCTKQDCMYLHEMGDHAASFTKEDMANGKHTEYENQLIQEFFDNQKVSPPTTIVNGLSQEQEKIVQRKSSLSGSQATSCVICVASSSSPVSVASSGPSVVKCGRPPSQITPIGTDPNDATKIYSCSSSSVSENCHSSKSISNKVSPIGPVEYQPSLETSDHNTGCDVTIGRSLTPPRPDLSFIHLQNSSTAVIGDNHQQTSNSLLDSFYFLNSQATVSQPYDQSINQQVNNNASLANYSQSSFKTNPEHKFKDNADIDFDPINISRLGLAELIETESRQKQIPYLPQLNAPLQRTVQRSTGHEFMMQSNNDFYGNNGNHNSNNLNNRMSAQSFSMYEKQSINSNNGLSATVAPISSGYPSPPPGFEVNHSCIGGDPPNTEIMNMIMGNNPDMYSRYHNQHSSPDIPLNMNHHNNSYGNQYSIPSGYGCYSSNSGFSNGSMLSGGGGGGANSGYSDLNSQSQPWKPSTQPMYCDGPAAPPDLGAHQGLRSSAATGAGATAYNRSHSMNENTGIRNSEWNGFASYNNTNDSHMSNYHFY